ncbi:PKD domain-containing protein [Methanolobus sp. WCC4]|uniref:PKD domain-containing protein n=1 Tax=Methanolobus sp. WCC4 TaxID=3125784 RepID=UPI0030F79FCE
MVNNFRKILCIGITLIVIILSMNGTASADEVNINFQSGIGIYVQALAISENYAYAAGSGAFYVIDITDPENIFVVGTLNRICGMSMIFDVTLSDNYAYVADYENGIEIMDISDPLSPQLVSRYGIPCSGRLSASEVVISDNYAYVAEDNIGLLIIDISDISSPTLIGTYETGDNGDWKKGVDVKGNYAYLADETNGLVIINVTTPTSPTIVGTYDTAGSAWDVKVSGNYAYVADGPNGLVIVDITDPTSPSLVGTCDTDDWAWDVVISGDYAYIADEMNGLVIVDISNPESPTFAGGYDACRAYNVAVSGNDVYVAGNNVYVAGTGIIALQTDISLVPNNPPIAAISPIDYASEGSPITFNASESYDPDDNLLTYKWDFDNDGKCDFESESPYATHTWDDDYTGDVKLEVSDGILTSTDTIAVTVGNIAPTITSFGVQQTDPVEIGTEIGLSCTFTDPGLGDTHDCIIDWGDGTATELLSITNPVSSSHVYSMSGVYTVNLIIEDDDTGYDTEEYQYVVVYDSDEGFVSGELNCPAHLYAYDFDGIEIRYTGSVGSDIFRDIPNSFYNGPEYDPEKIIILGQSDTIVYVVDSYDEGTFDLKLKQSNPEGLIEVEYLNVDLDKDTTATISVNSETNDFSMHIDMDNNGEIDIIKELDSVAINGNIVNAPTAVISSFEPDTASEGSPVTFNASESYDPDDDELQYRWDFNNDGTWDSKWSSNYTATHTWDDDYSGDVKLEVSDGILTSTDTITVTVGNVAPVVGLIDSPIYPVLLGTDIAVSASFEDDGKEDTHMPVWNWGDGNYSSDGAFKDRSGEVSGTYTYGQPGVYTITLEVEDDDGGSGTRISEQYVVVYDSDGGFVTGGGWISSPEGAYVTDPTLTGKTTFGFVSKFKKGATVPTGSTEFQFHVADLNFKSTTYDWLVIASSKAMYKGTGTINDEGNYGFMISAVDAELTPSIDIDLFRMKIWDIDDGEIIYDNMLGADETADPTTAIQGGSIKIHNEK